MKAYRKTLLFAEDLTRCFNATGEKYTFSVLQIAEFDTSMERLLSLFLKET